MDFLVLIFILFHALTVTTTNSAEILTLHNSKLDKDPTIGISVSNQEIHEVANSVLLAETWLKNNVLINYPASKITHIVVAHNLLCSNKNYDNFYHELILPALKNIHYSLTRWGLHSEIKVTTTFTSHCFSSHNDLIKSVINFINYTNSSYLIDPHHEINLKFETLVKTHLEFIKKIGFLLTFDDIKLVQNNEHLTKLPSTMRKLSYVVPTVEGPLPPLVGVGPGPVTSPPSPMATLPPLTGFEPKPVSGPVTSPPNPMTTLPPLTGVEPRPGPMTSPAHPHHSHHYHNLPPCNPWGAPAPGHGVGSGTEKLWCVAKPSVPAETLQEAMDYACGEGGADCEEIQANGSCYYPDTVVAHASFAFNSYWQKNKRSAASCNFAGTAMVINSDPSFRECRFTVT